MKAVLLDMDDTLYDEMSFVASGFRAVAKDMAGRCGIEPPQLVEEMMEILQRDGRGKVFDTALKGYGVHDEQYVQYLVDLYRRHQPQIKVFEDVCPVLELLKRRGLRIGVITDGHGPTQRRKFEALEIEKYIDIFIATDDLGAAYWKPHPLAFAKALDKLSVTPQLAACVGDNPTKDFKGPRSLGMLTIHITRRRTCDASICQAVHHASDFHRVAEILLTH
jgi:putative hydrolase of the HAD superfamily